MRTSKSALPSAKVPKKPKERDRKGRFPAGLRLCGGQARPRLSGRAGLPCHEHSSFQKVTRVAVPDHLIPLTGTGMTKPSNFLLPKRGWKEPGTVGSRIL